MTSKFKENGKFVCLEILFLTRCLLEIEIVIFDLCSGMQLKFSKIGCISTKDT